MEHLLRVARNRDFWIVFLIFGPFLAWLFFTDTSYSRHLTDILSGIMPGWLATLGLSLVILFAAIIMTPVPKPAYVVIVSYSLNLVCCVLFPVSLRFHPAISVAILVALYVEVYTVKRRRSSTSVAER